MGAIDGARGLCFALKADHGVFASREFAVDDLQRDVFADAFVKETIRSFRVTTDIQKNNGELGCHRYIISNCQSAYNVAEVLALAKLVSPTNDCSLDIVPLFETVEDLAAAEAVMHTLYTNPHYANHLASRANVQHIMLGFSDGTKDGGYLRANWSIYRAKEALSRVSRTHEIKVIFFDGRGGPPGRGGGNNASYYAAHGQDIENQAIHVTIQGQTVSSTYGTLNAATFNIERLLTAGLENHLFPDHAREMSQSDRKHLDELAEASYHAYLDLKNNPDFVPYLEKMTPLKWYGDSNIASRPTKRSGDEGMKFEDLRAIPFVGAWAKMKQNIPGYYGVGAAIAGLKSPVCCRLASAIISAWRSRLTTDTTPLLMSSVSMSESSVSIWSSRCSLVSFLIGQIATTGG